MQYVWDESGRRYLDALGGIVTISVGHCHPDVVEAARKQNELLQHSTTIYLHPNIAEYAEKLASKMPGELKVCYFVNSGSEANDLAMLMARAYTGNYDMIALRNAYHGGNASGMGLTAHSTWKYNVPQSFGVHHSITPDPYRGIWGHDNPDAGKNYAADVKNLIEYATPGQIAGYIAESIQGVGGCIVFPDGYLQHTYEHVRAAGGVCIADEVQSGFGRTGTHYWGFETQGVLPDIVCMAKGIGNGCPLGAVVTTPKIAAALSQRIHFNTFGGNPVVSAQGKAVLEVIEREKLQANSLAMGAAPQRRPFEAEGKAQHHRRRARQRPHARHRAGQRPRHQGAGQGRMRPGPRDLPRHGPVVRQRRPARPDHPLLAAHVHQPAGRRLHSRGPRSGVRQFVASAVPAENIQRGMQRQQPSF